jgi:hypothetical protein
MSLSANSLSQMAGSVFVNSEKNDLLIRDLEKQTQDRAEFEALMKLPVSCAAASLVLRLVMITRLNISQVRLIPAGFSYYNKSRVQHI